ncbi:NADP-dependent oxidoreductase [Leptospira wolffii]|uniref:NADP-dependent oxidoreductase n=1 Tax=Leptospira wolffii TaxID=409998 RepID=UPI001082E0A0|nr:NADP-dependent oxidoreductase [Leptospira wolffii]TGK64686.1 NADP-dependent oxidoreductase [Leptospira wolffii]TGK72774.1 NADP-dependent oxidoreductase [Leptospira wolffii]TGK76915.1 NADP-dependent oxidoreductase [Leptospira wolffii]TGL26628.1 NADP-dependent oxidoreductase [Leptospira wolffii]
MKAVQFKEFGTSEVLQLVDLPVPKPGEGEILVRISASGVNPVDWKIREGRLQSRMPNRLPIVPGWEFSGTVVERGHSARRFEIGEEVFSYCRRTWIENGSYAEYISLPESYLAKKPQSLTHEEAAAVPLSGLTAYQCLFQVAGFHPGERVLVLGASGGVGSYAIQLAKEKGAQVVAVASSRNENYVRGLGADEFLDYAEGSVSDSYKERFSEGADLVLDCIGGESFTQVGACVKPGGVLVSLIMTEFPSPSYKGVYHFVEPNSKQLEILSYLIDSGKIKVHLSEILPLEEAALAQEKISKLHTRGKIVLKI